MLQSEKRPKVIICGAGIGGLTVAHELAKQSFEVVVYERNPILGGLARSTYYTDPATQERYPVEYSWRIYGTAYKNLLRVMQEIPLRANSAKTVRDNLIQVWSYIFPRFDKKEVVIGEGGKPQALIEDFQKGDWFKLLDKVLYCVTISKSRMNSFDSLTWREFCEDLSPEANKYMVRMWGPVLGMDPTFMSFPVVARMANILLAGFLPKTDSLYVMNKPTNDGWFDEWTAHLQAQGVTLKPNSEILDFRLHEGAITSVTIRDNQSRETVQDEADYFVCGMSVEALANIVSANSSLKAEPVLAKTIPLAKVGRQIQLSVQIFLSKRLVYPTKGKNVLYLPDTPWALIIEPEDLIWEKTYSTNDNVKTVLSVGICQTDAPGILHQKPFVECTEKEIEEEVWAQMVRSYYLSSIKTESGEPLSPVDQILFYLWESYRFDPAQKKIDVWEPKFSNNANALQYQPTSVTAINNFFFATAYTQTDRFIYSMEAAAEAGICTANAIKAKAGKGAMVKVYSLRTAPVLLTPLVLFDALLYAIGLPHLSRILKYSVVVIALYVLALLAVCIWAVMALIRLV